MSEFSKAFYHMVFNTSVLTSTMFVLSLVVLMMMALVTLGFLTFLLESYNPFILLGVCGLILMVIALYAPVAIVVRILKQ